MNKHKNTYLSILKNPVQSNIDWKDVESMLKYLGAKISEREGSRIGIEINGVIAVFHRPHPQKETDKGAVRSMQKYLNNAGITKKSFDK